MGYDTAAKTDPDSVIDGEAGDVWSLKGALAADELRISALELEPGDERAKLAVGGAPP